MFVLGGVATAHVDFEFLRQLAYTNGGNPTYSPNMSTNSPHILLREEQLKERELERLAEVYPSCLLGPGM